MSGNSKIEWTDATWNPIRARLKQGTPIKTAKGLKVLPAGTWGYHCERVSPGCKHCYACAMNKRTLPAWGTGLDYTVPNRELVEIYLDEDELRKPLHWKKPRMIFVCSMTDLFGEWVPDEMIDRVFAVMALAYWHTFQVLTKRSHRMWKWFGGAVWEEGAEPETFARVGNEQFRLAPSVAKPGQPVGLCTKWPLPNVWLGVSVEDRAHKGRMGDLGETPAAIRFVSLEPLLEDIGELGFTNEGDIPDIDWVIVGGESGVHARPCNLAWVRSIMRQSRAAGVKVFVKQLGANPQEGSFRFACELDPRKGANSDDWPRDLRLRETPLISPDTKTVGCPKL